MFPSFKNLGIVILFASTLAVNAYQKSAPITWYDPKAVMDRKGMGACGETLDQSMPIAALSESYFNRYPGKSVPSNSNPLCGKEIIVSYQGKTVKVKVMDACASCKGPHDVDLSKSSFANLADTSVGVLQGSWEFVNPQDEPVSRRSIATHRLHKSRKRLDAKVTRNVTEVNAKGEDVELESTMVSRITGRVVQGSRG